MIATVTTTAVQDLLQQQPWQTLDSSQHPDGAFIFFNFAPMLRSR